MAWFGAAAILLAIATYGLAEISLPASTRKRNMSDAIPTIGIAPWFFAGSLFPISALPAWLAAITKLLPVTHAVALMRYGLVAHNSAGLSAIWGLHDPTTMAVLSALVLVIYAAVLMLLAVRAFSRRLAR